MDFRIIILLVVVAVVVIAFAMRKTKANAPATSTTSAYGVTATKGEVVSQPTRYKRPNADGSRMFEGTEFVLRSALNGNTATLSCEGEFDFVSRGDFLAVVFARYDVGVPELSSNLVVAVFNHTKASFQLIRQNVKKCADDRFGGEEGLEREIQTYSKAVLGYNIRVR